MTIMMAPTMARRPLTARSSTAARESPKSWTSTGGAGRIRKGLDGLADRVVLIGTHGAFAQPEQIAVLIVQGYGVDAGRFDGRAHLLADGIVIDKRTLCRAEGFAVLHKSATWGSSVYIYRTTTPSAVMLLRQNATARQPV